MKKKIIAVSLIVAMMAVTVVSGTFAYFFDTDSDKNTFTVGNVEIDLVEKGDPIEGGEPGEFEEFEQDQKLIPGGDPAKKLAWITNTGDSEAWIWVEIWIPAVLDNPGDASENSLHFNYYGQFITDYYDGTWASAMSQTPVTDGVVDAETHAPTVEGMVAVADGLWEMGLDDEGAWLIRTETDAETGVAYNVYTFKMANKLPAGATSLPVLRQVYMDADVKQCTDETHANCYILTDGTHYTGSWELIVKAYAMQGEGFGNVDEAIAAYWESQETDEG